MNVGQPFLSGQSIMMERPITRSSSVPPMFMQSGMQPVQYYASVSIELVQTAVNSLQNARESPFQALSVLYCVCFA